MTDAQKFVVVVGWHVVVAALHIVAWCVVANERMLGEPVSVQVGAPVIVTVLFVPAKVMVAVHGAEPERATVELLKDMMLGIVAPVNVSLAML